MLLALIIAPPSIAGPAAASPSAAASAASSRNKATLAPDFTLEGRNGGVVALDSLRGKTVLVDFWASWCKPCEQSFPWLAAMNDRYSAKGLAIVAINLDKERDAATAFLTGHPAPFLVAFDPEGKTAEAFHVSAMPSTFLIDPSGEIVYKHAGFDPKKTGPLESLIKESCQP